MRDGGVKRSESERGCEQDDGYCALKGALPGVRKTPPQDNNYEETKSAKEALKKSSCPSFLRG
jgi:hypothetical protein